MYYFALVITFTSLIFIYLIMRLSPTSPGGFFMVGATDPAKANEWVIFLEGGQWRVTQIFSFHLVCMCIAPLLRTVLPRLSQVLPVDQD